MHDTAYHIGGLVLETYLPSSAAKILEVGSMNVNGSLRDHSPRNAEYVGLDFEAGASVDLVVKGNSDWSVPDGYFDLVIASSVFEHDSAFWQTFLEMCRKAKPGGHIYVNAPSNGTVHRYPRDCWRFYPDAGLALEDWACSQGFDLTMIESFVAEKAADNWNDFCAVFRLNPCNDELNRDFVYNKVASTNALSWRSSLTMNPLDDTQDTRLLRAAREEADALREEVHSAHREADRLRVEADTLRDEGAALHVAVRKAEEDAAALRIEMLSLRELLETSTAKAERQSGTHKLEIENREKNIRQLADEAKTLKEEVDRLAGQKANAEHRLQERFREIAGLTRLIQERDHVIAAEQTRAEWLRDVVSVLTKGYSRALRGRLARMLPTYFSHKRQEAWLRREGLFDIEEYTTIYPDVTKSKIHPLRHYINHGMQEGRLTGPRT
ncbi:methyltransferase domain-containing protein [Qipengyuania sp. GH25]|uniref:Methyltransferase domain-containing protein n=1 Tax=Qipengyuania pacifica TaxID=2860199 RepID=A0ABS7JCR8_9SPHN|nr:class I SAM-dependent methyltransferase [Qipengyuania aerophila]MBX7487827.1 methyltransferase domain-containing protein [Qipengyuania aerophila]